LSQSTGVYILGVTPGSPADKAGLKGAGNGSELPSGGDLIIAIDDQNVDNFEDFMGYLLTYKKPGDRVTIQAVRDGETLEFDLVLGKRP
jgi:S1-C subfamily serine protease